MSDDDHSSQITVPPSFVALFVAPGRTRPNAPRAEIMARYEFCEDLATLLTSPADTQHWANGVAEAVVLQRVHQGLQGGAAGVNDAEAGWVIRRLAELLGWPDPGPSDPC